MDGVEQSTLGRALRAARSAIVAGLLVAACGSGVHNGPSTRVTAGGSSPITLPETMDTHTNTVPALPGRVVVPPLYETTVATAIDLEVGIATLDPGDADVFNWRPGIPDDLPSTAYRFTLLGKGEHADPPQRPRELVVATQWPRAVRANVLCLVDAAQVPCSDNAAVWRVEFDEPAMALLELPEAEGRRDIVFVEERDGRPEGVRPVSLTRSIDGWDVPLTPTGDAPPVVTNPLGGCDWVLFMDNLKPRETFTPTRAADPSRLIYMVISVCDGHPAGYEMTPLVVVDETTVAQVDTFRPFIARPGTTYAWELPDELLDSASKIRGVVVRRAPTRGGVWVTHPLTTVGTSDQPATGIR